MVDQFSRTKSLIGEEGFKKLRTSKVIVYGLGGVGSFVIEALARAGIGCLTIVDYDVVSITNLNRQIQATHQTIGKSKVEVTKQRILEIDPNINVISYNVFYTPENSAQTLNQTYDYVIDAVDNVTAKIDLADKANQLNLKIISCMGTGNKLDPSKFEFSDIFETSVCPLAKVVRKGLKEKGVKSLRVLYSKEQPIKRNNTKEELYETQLLSRKQIPASISFVPSVAGLLIAGEVIRELLKK